MQVQSRMTEVPVAGGAMPVFVSQPEGTGPFPVVLVIMEAFGLNAHIQDVARRIAAEGYGTVAPDLYWRGGKNRSVGYDQLPQAIALMQSLRDEQVVGDLSGAIAWIEHQPWARA